MTDRVESPWAIQHYEYSHIDFWHPVGDLREGGYE